MRPSLATCLGALSFLFAAEAHAEAIVTQGTEDLSNLSIEQLANIQVRSASKREQPLSAVPASLYVIDHDQIVRSAALTIPEMLRLAPNLQVYQQSPSHWVVTARGLNERDVVRHPLVAKIVVAYEKIDRDKREAEMVVNADAVPPRQ